MFNKKAFTIAEIMVVVFIIALLAAAIYIGTTPYYQRSRDAGRLTQVQSYASVFATYKQPADTFPTTSWSGWNPRPEWYCISEIFSRNNRIHQLIDKLHRFPNESRISSYGSTW